MATKNTAAEIPAMKENFAELFNEMFGEDKGLEGSVVKEPSSLCPTILRQSTSV